MRPIRITLSAIRAPLVLAAAGSGVPTWPNAHQNAAWLDPMPFGSGAGAISSSSRRMKRWVKATSRPPVRAMKSGASRAA